MQFKSKMSQRTYGLMLGFWTASYLSRRVLFVSLYHVNFMLLENGIDWAA